MTLVTACGGSGTNGGDSQFDDAGPTPSVSPSPGATPPPSGTPTPAASPTPQPTVVPSVPAVTPSPSPTLPPPPTPSPTPGATPTPTPTPVVPSKSDIEDIYGAANGCFTVRSDAFSLTHSAAEDAYTSSADPLHAQAFYFKPTDLGQYLLLSDYERQPGEAGTKKLLGLSDQLGEFLDEAGNLVGEVGVLVRAVGDMADFFVDIADPNDDSLQTLGRLIEAGGDRLGAQDLMPALAMVGRATDLAVWELIDLGEGRYGLAQAQTGQRLVLSESGIGLTAADTTAPEASFLIESASACDAYPEAQLNAAVADAGPANYLSEVALFAEEKSAGLVDNDDIYGFVDAHAHISAYEFIGGRINYGDPFHKFGVDHALEDCSENHGEDGRLGLVEIVTSGTAPEHATRGWPDFEFWPRHNSLQHHQSYYKWIERAHLAGLKILVNDLVHNEVLCQINPQKENDCDAIPAIALQAQRMAEMERYIDAQEGGPGEGWFRIVTSPSEAREVIAQGKLAVVLGMELSKPLNCGEFLDSPECSTEEMIQRLDDAQAMGVTTFFPVHKFDNGFGGHLPDLGSVAGISGVLYAGNLAETGHPVEFELCPGAPEENRLPEAFDTLSLGLIDQLLFQLDFLGADFPATPEEFSMLDPRGETSRERMCNVRGLTELGYSLIDQLMQRGMIIETDHISQKAMRTILQLAQPFGYPTINSHGGWGGPDPMRDLTAERGGTTHSFASGSSTGWARELLRNGERPRADAFKVAGRGTSGFASDVNGIANLPGSPGAPPEGGLYPFTSVDGRVVFDKQTTGDIQFSLYNDDGPGGSRGTAHYGLYADKIADMQLHSDLSDEEVTEALKQFFSSAEGYLRMWERTIAASEAYRAANP